MIKSEKGFEVFIQSKLGLIGIIETNFDTTPNCETYLRQLKTTLISVCLRKKMTKDQIQCSV